MVETVVIKEKINSSLEMNSTAVEFLEGVNKIDDFEVVVDFTGVVFVSRSFAQSYFSTKVKLDKNIIETNIPKEVKPLMDMIKRKFE